MIRKPLPPVYYFAQRYLIPNDRRGWVTVNTAQVVNYLLSLGFSVKKEDKEPLCEVELFLLRIQTEHDVAYVGALAGYSPGLYTINGERILVTSGPVFVQPVRGAWPVVGKFLKNLLGDEQLPYLYGWLKFTLEMYRLRAWQPAQALVFCGPPGCGKNLVRIIVTELCGGRVAFPYAYMTGRTSFNSELFVAEILAIEDQAESPDMRARRHFAASIKDIAVNEQKRCERKHAEPLTLVAFQRLIISLNDEPERMLVLPPIDQDVADKITLFKVGKHELPMPTRTGRERTEFMDTIKKELPGFAHFLSTYQIPEGLQSDRYGVQHYHHPELLRVLEQLSPEIQLLELIDSALFRHMKVPEYSGTANELANLLKEHEGAIGFEARNLLKYGNTCGTYLQRLERLHASRISRRVVNGRTFWTIKRPDWREVVGPDGIPDKVRALLRKSDPAHN